MKEKGAQILKLYYHLFESNRLDNSKPYKFVDYLITGDNLLFNLKKDKSRFEEIKKGISLKTKNNSLINEQLLNKSIYEYLRCDFSNSFMKKLTEKINVFLMNRYINKKKEKNSAENSISIEKKDKFTYSNFLADKLKDNINKSCLSFTNDTEYFKSLIYVCNKYSKYIGKKEIPEKILIESLEKNKKILENFKNMDEDGDTANKIEIGYLNDLLHNKSIRKYISKKLKSLNDGILGNNQILKTLDINIFYKILSSLIKNKNDDDVDKLYKLFEEEIIVNDNNNLDKNDLKNFVILFRFLLELELTNKLNNNDITNNLNESNINNISLIKEIYENINIQLNNKQKEKELDDITLSNSNKKNKVRNRIKIKTKKSIKNLETSENDSSKIDITDTNEDNINKSNANINNQNQSFVSNISDKNSSSTIIVKPKKRNKNSKIIPFKIPYPINNTNNNNNTTNIKTNNSLFEINNINDISNNISMPNNQINKMEDQNKNNLVEKAHFEIYNESQNENNDNNIKDKDKEKNKNKKGRKKNIEENKENLNNSINNVSDNKINDTTDNKLLNKCVTFYSMNHSTVKELNLGKYILNKLSSGQDIFKLIIEKPKIRRSKEKENSENSLDKENENEENVDNKDNNKDNDKDNNKDNNKDKDNKDNNQDIDINKDNKENKKRSKKIKKEKIKEENNIIKEEKNKIKEEEKELKIKNEKDMRIKKEKDEDIIIRNDKNEEIKIKEEQDKIENKINNIKKEVETREDSSKSNDKNDKITNFINIKKINFNNNIFLTKNEKNRNIDIIHFNNGMIREGEPIKEITRNDLKHSPNISVKISQKTIKFPTYKTIDIDMKDNIKKNNELIFNINNSNTKYLFSTNKNNYNNLETKTKVRKNKNDINKKDSFKNINIQIDRQSVEIKGGNVILNDKRDNQNEDIIKIKDYFNAI